MKTKKININEFKDLIKNLIKEEYGQWSDGQLDMFANQKEVNKLEKEKERLYRLENPTKKDLINAVNLLKKNSEMDSLLTTNGFDTYFSKIDNSKLYGFKLENKNSKPNINGLLDDLKKIFKYPNKLIKFSGHKEYAPEIKIYGIGVDLTEADKKLTKEDKLKGGLGDNLSIKDIADKFKVSLDEINKELSLGIKVEMEHTNDESSAKEIAIDHLSEMPDYYTKLNKMEKDSE